MTSPRDLTTHGDERWQSFPSYLETVVPRVLRFLDNLSLRITFFIVGQDAAFPRNRRVLAAIADAGHEIANHSFHHEPWLHLYSRTEIEREIASAERAISNATGYRVTGFRGPGFSVSDTVGDVLASRGYRYDASTLPTFLGPAARAYYLLTAKLEPEEKRRRARLFGRLRDGLRPLEPHTWETPSGTLIELPVTTTPVFRIPFHLSYLGWLLSYSKYLAHAHLRTALALCGAWNVAPSFLLHPLDFIGPDEAPELAFFPGMNLPLDRKLELAEYALNQIARQHKIVTMSEHAGAGIPNTQPTEPVGRGLTGSARG
jgi:hypothetical protein